MKPIIGLKLIVPVAMLLPVDHRWSRKFMKIVSIYLVDTMAVQLPQENDLIQINEPDDTALLRMRNVWAVPGTARLLDWVAGGQQR